MNLFSTVLTHAAPSANYRGESAENRAVLQKITKGRMQFAVVSPEAMRNAIRDGLRAVGLPCNRSRLHDEEQLAVKYEDYPDSDAYADDFFMGWLIAAGKKDREKIEKELEAKGRNRARFTFKRDSVLRMNLAVALEPYRHDTVFTQSPLQTKDSPWQNADSSQLLHRETTYTAFQYPFALNLDECREKAEWTRELLSVIGQLGGVAGNHARSLYDMAPASIVVRLTPRLAPGYDTYGFLVGEDGSHSFPEVVDAILNDDLPGAEFLVGGKIVRDMDEATLDALAKKNVVAERNAAKILDMAGDRAFG
ncbi:MAG: type I-B CRISPR-associated protein Cas7/Cst2/DevR [Synergistaceae bacterium]|nr:type I-B CRISPR-associated protein Cas7/Cst2/DevR [Synergistota bacterium]NLM70363.1 type I-B CRISPR-associated protein Cas7/Cst2/DevR [Synergistaceae bacterium]